MKKLLIRFALTFVFMSGLYSTQGKANGAIIVLLPFISPDDYSIGPAYQDFDFNNSHLSEVFHSSESKIYVMRVDSKVFGSVSYYAQNGYNVALNLGDSNTVTFHYQPSLDTLVGKAEDGDCVFVLDRFSPYTKAGPRLN